MSGDAVRKLTAWTGVGRCVLIVGACLLPGNVPGFDATPEQVVRYTLDDRRALLVATVLIAVAFTLLIVFYAGLRTLLGRAEGAPALLSTIGYGSFLVVVAIALVAFGLLQAQAFAALDGDPATVKVLHERASCSRTSPASRRSCPRLRSESRCCAAGSRPGGRDGSASPSPRDTSSGSSRSPGRGSSRRPAAAR